MTTKDQALKLAREYASRQDNMAPPLDMTIENDRDILCGYIADTLKLDSLDLDTASAACAAYTQVGLDPIPARVTLAPARAAFLAAVKAAPTWEEAAEKGARAVWGALVALSRAELLDLVDIGPGEAARLKLGQPELAWVALTGGDGSVFPSWEDSAHKSDALGFLELEDAEVAAADVAAGDINDVEGLEWALAGEGGWRWLIKAPPARILPQEGAWDFQHPDCICGSCWEGSGDDPACFDPIAQDAKERA